METLSADYAGARPTASCEEASELLKEIWGLTAEGQELPSERDQLFRMVDGTTVRGFLKISNGIERKGVLEFERSVVEACAAGTSCFQFPRWQPTPDGESFVRTAVGASLNYVRLLAPVSGVPLAGFTPKGREVRYQVGRMAGLVRNALQPVPGVRRDLVWDLEEAPELISRHMGHLPQEGRPLVERVLAAFEDVVVPRAADLRRSVIHNDLNPANIMVDPHRLKSGAPNFSGLVDFGDAVGSWAIAELAVAGAYAACGSRSPLAALCEVASGFAAEHEVEVSEADVVFELARLRLALSVTISAVRAKQDLENDYLLVSAAPAWDALRKLDSVHPRFGMYRLREACGHSPVPGSPRLIGALREASAGAAPVMNPDPHTHPGVVLDLSIESGDDAGEPELGDPGPLTRRLFEQIHDAGAMFGLGRYAEARWWYVGDLYRVERDDMDEMRSIHLGVDLFASPGTPVMTPLPGRVVSVVDNQGHLEYGPTVLVEHELPDPEDDGTIRFWTLYGHLTPESLSLRSPGEVVEAGAEVGRIGSPEDNGGWPPHLHFQVVSDRLGFEGTFPGVAPPSELHVWSGLSPDPNHLLAIPLEAATPERVSQPLLRRQRDERLGPSLSLSYNRPLHIVRGRGARLYDIDGQSYLDCVNNVTHVGHSHPAITAAASRQMSVLNTNTRYLHDAILEYAERLGSLFPSPLGVCFFVCSGTEANELALRMARTATGRVGAVVLDGAYHGNSSSVINLSPYKFNGPGGKGLRPWVRVADMPDAYRGVYRGPEEEVAGPYAAEVARALEALETEPTWFEDRPPGAAAFFHESILSCGGQIPLPQGYLAAAYAAAREIGALCIADEVQTGFGRVGSHWWAFEEHGVVPDIVTLGKPMGNGHPLSAVVTTREIAERFANGMEYFNTFGGNPVSCAIGLEVLRIIEDENLRENAESVGDHLLEGLRELCAQYEFAGDARGRGLFVGIEFVREDPDIQPAADLADRAVQRMRDRGFLLSTDGPDHNVIKIKPPMVFSRNDADSLLSNLGDVLSETAFGGSPL